MYTSQSEPMPGTLASRMVMRSPIFYGWIIAAAGTLGMILTSPGQTYAVSIFLEHFIADLGISRSLVSTIYTAGTLIGSFALPLIGRKIDDRGPRRMVVLISLAFGIACIYMGFVLNAFMLLLGFVAIRMLGQGSLSLVSQYTINQWWVRRRGSVMGISNLVVMLLGMGATPSLIYWLVNSYGWRTAYPILGLTVLLVMAPLGYLFYRSQPERYGLTPDGPMTDAARQQTLDREEEWTLAEARRTPTFWILVTSQASISMLSTGLMFHMVSIFADSGLSEAAAAQAFVPLSLTAAFVTLGSGILIDRLPARFLLAAGLVLQAVSLVMAHQLGGVQWAFAYGVVLGVTMGLIRSVGSVIWPTYFGRKHLGSITGATTTFFVAGSALGPMPFGIARDWLGSYNAVLNVSALIPLVLAVAVLFLRKPEKEA